MDFQSLNEKGALILDAAITVHRILGPGLLESAYFRALRKELQLRGLHVQWQVPVPLYYKGEDIGEAYMLDLLVDDEIIIELKAVEVLLPIHQAQVITYLKLSERHLGYLVNFNVPLLKQGFKRLVHDWPKEEALTPGSSSSSNNQT
ncbi:MAG: GxxExxY protein [Chitinophagaceae bacterium]|nr:MAG: GxxExxY protein [Chitinophagaceae bacterium]